MGVDPASTADFTDPSVAFESFVLMGGAGALGGRSTDEQSSRIPISGSSVVGATPPTMGEGCRAASGGPDGGHADA
jgi:hypothetical protein